MKNENSGSTDLEVGSGTYVFNMYSDSQWSTTEFSKCTE